MILIWTATKLYQVLWFNQIRFCLVVFYAADRQKDKQTSLKPPQRWERQWVLSSAKFKEAKNTHKLSDYSYFSRYPTKFQLNLTHNWKIQSSFIPLCQGLTSLSITQKNPIWTLFNSTKPTKTFVNYYTLII